VCNSASEAAIMTTTWPSREEWAKERRTPYYDRFLSTSNSLAEYATPEEIAALKAALRKRWRNLGKEIRELRGNAASGVISDLKSDRSSLKWALVLIAQGELPATLRLSAKLGTFWPPFTRGTKPQNPDSTSAHSKRLNGRQLTTMLGTLNCTAVRRSSNGRGKRFALGELALVN
jgi:hypothetical protein